LEYPPGDSILSGSYLLLAFVFGSKFALLDDFMKEKPLHQYLERKWGTQEEGDYLSKFKD
jgi:hypothetical protein